MIAVLEAARAGLFTRDQWARNVVAGVIVGVVALPLAMAFAIASGVKPEQGIYTAIVAGIAVSLFGGTRIQIAGPTGAFVVILAGVTAKYGVEGLLLATCMAGVILILLGAAHFGGVHAIHSRSRHRRLHRRHRRHHLGRTVAGFLRPARRSAAGTFTRSSGTCCRRCPDCTRPPTLLALLSLLLAIYAPRIPGCGACLGR